MSHCKFFVSYIYILVIGLNSAMCQFNDSSQVSTEGVENKNNQESQFSKQIRFVQHLQGLGYLDKAIVVLHDLSGRDLSYIQKDSVNFLLGKYYYNQKSLEDAIQYFSFVKLKPLVIESRFFEGLLYAHLDQLDKAEGVFDSLQPEQPLYHELKKFEVAGLALLERDTSQYIRYAQMFSDDFFQMQQQKENLDKIYREISAFNKKSQFLAGALSAIVPGLGKVYAGKTGQGISSFLQSAMLGAMAYESYQKAGVRSARFFVFGGIFSAFYIANIWGSALTVKIRQNEFNHETDHKILFEIHIPVRTIFY